MTSNVVEIADNWQPWWTGNAFNTTKVTDEFIEDKVENKKCWRDKEDTRMHSESIVLIIVMVNVSRCGYLRLNTSFSTSLIGHVFGSERYQQKGLATLYLGTVSYLR